MDSDDDQDAEGRAETPGQKRQRLSEILAEHQKQVGGRKRKRLFFVLLEKGYPAWSDNEPETCAYVLAGFAVQGVMGCKDPRAASREAAKDRAKQMAESQERQDYAPKLNLDLETVRTALFLRLAEHFDDAIEAIDENGFPVWGVRQQAAQLGLNLLAQAKKDGEGAASEEERRVLAKMRNRPPVKEAA